MIDVAHKKVRVIMKTPTHYDHKGMIVGIHRYKNNKEFKLYIVNCECGSRVGTTIDRLKKMKAKK